MHQCSVCQKGFPSGSKLQRHYLIHTGQKPFICLVCGKAFRQSVHLKKHSETHTGNYRNWSPPTESLLHPISVPTNLDPSLRKSGHYLTTDTPLLPTVSFQRDGPMQRTLLELKVHLKMHSQIHECKPTGFQTIPMLGSQQSSSRGRMRVNHECPTCSKTFCSPSKLKRHFLTHTGQKPFSCEDCGKTFRQVSHLKTHLYASHNISKPFQCHVCGRAFHLSTHLKRHQFSHKTLDESQNTSQVDDHRDAVSKTEHAYQNSDKGMTTPETNDSKVFELDIIVKPEHWKLNFKVDKDFPVSTLQDLTATQCKKIRQKTKNQPLNHQCLACLKSFPSPSKLQRHMLTHTGQRPFGCYTCGKKFRQPTHLRIHSRTHLCHTQHQCLLCFKYFPCASKLQRHNLVHTGLRPFRCLACGKTFRQTTHLKVHEGTHKKAHLCTICQKGFDTPSKLSRHFLIHTGIRPFKCSFCTKTYRQPCHLRSHEQRTHEIKTCSDCDTCITSFETERDLQVHKCVSRNVIEFTESSPYQCAICFKDFKTPSKLQRHYVTHTGERPFLCKVCEKTFTQASHLKTHQRTHK
ncbi:unnamed protein product [Oncorhynchus mykiss]|uniref:C2H2-type domain-containing protein n=1 Tax=Oncorhynchus mykiss TaxID=8022 RepID=A0A060XYV0_ONCMY|nr:unnamed protein product [Oncorhynchus mykiss]